MFKKTLCTALMLAALVPAWAAEWMTDLEAAKAKAAAENKAVLIDFTGSDWCGWCVRLRKQVLDTPAFETYAKDKFVLMEVDVPHNPKFDKELRARNEKLCEQYNVRGFPTLIVVTPDGEVVGGFSGFKPTVEAAAKSFDSALETAQLLQKADSLPEADQLATLIQAYKRIPANLQESATGLRKRIIALDPQDSSGLARMQRLQDERAAFQAALSAARTPKEALTVVNAALATAAPENKLGMLQIKFQIMYMSAESVDDIKAAAEVMREGIQNDPEAQPGDMKRVEALLADPEAVLKRIQRLRNQGKKTAPQK